MKKQRVTGIGGIFFKCTNPKATKDWYANHLGFDTDEYGSLFKFRDVSNPNKVGHLQWGTFDADTEYFLPSEKDFMINYRVADIEHLVEELKKEGVEVLDNIETYDYGKFVHILDPDGNKIELWEPVDEALSPDK